MQLPMGSTCQSRSAQEHGSMPTSLTWPRPIQRADSLRFVADLSYRLRNRTGGSVAMGDSAALYRSENIVSILVVLEILAGFEDGPTRIKWSRNA